MGRRWVPKGTNDIRIGTGATEKCVGRIRLWLCGLVRERRIATPKQRLRTRRAGTDYPWGNNSGEGNANCNGCGSQWDCKQTSPVGSFKLMRCLRQGRQCLGMSQDCFHVDYDGAPADGSAWTNGNATVAEINCGSHEIRGAAWSSDPQDLNAAYRNSALSDKRYNNLG